MTVENTELNQDLEELLDTELTKEETAAMEAEIVALDETEAVDETTEEAVEVKSEKSELKDAEVSQGNSDQDVLAAGDEVDHDGAQLRESMHLLRLIKKLKKLIRTKSLKN